MVAPSKRPPRLPPRWFVRGFWAAHRALYRLTGGRAGLSRFKPGKWGTLRLTTTGRRSGQQRSVLLGYVDDGPNFSLLAMNGWAEPDPAWWLNLQANPEATVDLPGGSRQVRARAAVGAERERLWQLWRESGDEKLDDYAALRSRQTAVVVLEPRGGAV